MGTITVTTAGEYATLDILEPAPVQGAFSTSNPRDPRLGVPADANLIYWNAAWTNVQQAFNALGANDILVLPERTAPYLLDASKGFLASGVVSISDHGAITQGPMWFSLSRAKRGIVGLGPGARIEIAPGHRILAPQWEDSGGVPGAGRIVTFTNGTTQELIGCAEKMIETTTPKAYFGNFTMLAKPMGGVAYHMIALSGPADDSMVERVNLIDSQGFSAVPNGEAGAIASNGDRTTIRRLIIEDTGSSPIMLNTCTGTLIEDVTVRRSRIGMPTMWNCFGVNTLRRFRSEYCGSAGLNLEKQQSTFALNWEGGACLVDKPAPLTGYYGLHVKIGGGTTSIKVKLTGVSLDKGPWPGSLSVQLYAGTSGIQKAADVTAYDNLGTAIPVRFAGTAI